MSKEYLPLDENLHYDFNEVIIKNIVQEQNFQARQFVGQIAEYFKWLK